MKTMDTILHGKGECYHDGQKFAYGSVIQINCNKW